MKIIRTLIALFASLVLIAGSVPTVLCAESAYDSESDYELMNKHSFLTEAGIVNFKYSTDALSSPLTRAEFARAMGAVYGISALEGESADCVFSDCDGLDVLTVKSINYLTALKVISGTGDGRFSPESSVTYAQALKIMVCALGYEHKAILGGGFPHGYAAAAQSLGITDGVSAAYTDAISGRDFINIVHSSLFVDIFQQITYGENPGYGTVKGETLLSESMKIQYLEDIMVSANSVTDLNSEGTAGAGCVVAGGVKYLDPGAWASPLVGRYADVFVKESDSGSPKTVIYAVPSSNDEGIVISYEDIEEIDGNVISWFNGTDTKKIKLSDSANMTVNSAVSPYNPAYIDTSLNGSVLVCKSRGSSAYDFVAVTQYTNIVVDSVDYNGNVLYDRLNPVNSVDLSSYIQDDACEIYADGKLSDISVIPQGSVVSVYETPDKGFIRIEAYKKASVTGRIDGVSESSVTIGASAYEMSLTYPGSGAELLGKTATLYFTPDGKVFAAEVSATSGNMYAYLISIRQKTGVDSGVMVRMLTQNGKIEEFDVADKVIHNGKTVTGESFMASVTEEGTTIQQLVQYKLTGDKKLRLINTTDSSAGYYATKYGEADFYCSVPYSTLRYRSSSRSFEAVFAVDSSTKVFMVAPGGYTDDTECFAYSSVSAFSSGKYHNVTAYCMNDGGIAEAVILWKDPSGVAISGNSTTVLIDRVSSVLDDEGDSVLKISGLSDGKYVEYLTDGTVYPNINGRPLKRGDIVRLGSYGGRIVNFKADVDVDTYKSANVTIGSFWDDYNAHTGVFYSVKSGYAMVVHKNGENLADIFETVTPEEMYTMPVSGSIMIYDSKLDEVYVGTASDILAYNTAGEDACRYYARLDYDNVRSIFIYK